MNESESSSWHAAPSAEGAPPAPAAPQLGDAPQPVPETPGAPSTPPGFGAQPWPAVPGTGQASGAPRQRSGLIFAIAALVAALLVVLAAMAIGGAVIVSAIRGLPGDIPPGSGIDEDPQPGVVLDAAGAPVDGLGTADAPARMGENSLRWPTDDGGTITVVVTDVDWDADAEIRASDPEAPAPEPGNGYALVSVEGTYTGEGHAMVGDLLDISVESESGFGFDEGTVRAPKPLWRCGGITDGESCGGQVVVQLPANERSSALVTVATWGGDYLYVSDR